MTAILAFLGVYVLSWPALIILCILGIIFEANEAHGWSMFVGLCTAAAAYFFFELSLMAIALYIVGYFVVGFVWSFWRYKRYCSKMVADNLDSSPGDRSRAIERMRPSNNLSLITTWVIVWPFSVIENLVGDLITLIQTTITTYFKGVYNSIFEGAASKLA